MQVLDFGLDAEGPVDFTTDPVTGDVYYVSITTNQVRPPPLHGRRRQPDSGRRGQRNPRTAARCRSRSLFSSAGSSDPDGDPAHL